MKKIISLMLVSILTLTMTACSSNDENKEDKTDDILETVQKNVQEQSSVKANMSNSAVLNVDAENEAKFEELGTFDCTINKDSKSDKITTKTQLITIASDGTKLVVPDQIILNFENGERDDESENNIMNLGGVYPFGVYSEKFENYFTTKDEVKTTKNESSTILEYSNDGSNVILEIDKNNMPIKMTCSINYETGETTYIFNDITFTK